MSSTMPLYFFRISHGLFAGASDQEFEFESHSAAWAEMTKVSGNLLGSITRSLQQNAEWRWSFSTKPRSPSSESA